MLVDDALISEVLIILKQKVSACSSINIIYIFSGFFMLLSFLYHSLL